MTEENEKNRQGARRLVAPILLVVFCIWYGSIILELPQGPGSEGPLGPSFVPWLWVSFLVVLTLVDIGTDYLGAPREKAQVVIGRKGILDALTLCLLMAGLALPDAIHRFFRRSRGVSRHLHLVERNPRPENHTPLRRHLRPGGELCFSPRSPGALAPGLALLKMDLLADGLVQALAWKPFLFAVLGSFLGIVFAAIPGLTVSMGIILLLPFTFHMASVTSMSLLVGVFVGGMTGGSISAILLNIPGNPAAIVTSLDGHPLARKGRAGVALGGGFFLELFRGVVQPRLPGDHSASTGGFRPEIRRARTGVAGLAGALPHLRIRSNLDEQGAHLGRAGLEFFHRRNGPHRLDTALHVFRRADSAGGFFSTGDDRAFRGARDHLGHARLLRLFA